MINGLSLLKGATSISIVGGTAAVHSIDGLNVSNGVHVVDTTVADLTLIPHATFKSKPHALQANGSFSKGKRDINYTLPTTLANGDRSYQVFRGAFELHPELTTAQILEMRLMACQLIMDGELDSFYRYGTLA